MSKTIPSVVKNRPFKIWKKGSIFNIDFSSFSHYFPSEFGISNSLLFNSLSSKLNLRFRRVVVRSTRYAYLSASSIESFRKVIAPYFRKKSAKTYKFRIKCYPYMPLTKKPAEVRMGGGKGTKVRDFFSPVKPGQVLFDVVLRDPARTKKLIIYASRKLSVPVKVFFI